MTAGVPVRGGSQARRRVLIRRASAGASGTRIVAVAVMLACAAALYALTGAEAFEVRRTVVNATRYSDREAVTGAILGGDRESRNLFRFATADAAARVAALPTVAGVEVRAILPDRLVVTVTERRPVLIWVTAGERFAVDAEGWIFAAVQEDPMGPGGPLAAIADERKSATALRVGERLPAIDLQVARQLATVTPELVASRTGELRIRVTDGQGYLLVARSGWTAIFGFYTASVRPPDLVPGQVQCLRSLLAAAGEAAIRRVILAPDGGACGTYVVR